jgi:SAM-dependent methyltransferase
MESIWKRKNFEMSNETNSKQLTMLDLIIEAHIDLKRQGPGSIEVTTRALSFIDGLNDYSKILDLACGTGGQTIVIAENTTGDITGIDIIPIFIDVFNENAKKRNFQDRVHGVVGSMDELSFEKATFDLIWSEGAIDNIGFEKGIRYWHEFLKNDGYVAVTCPSWLTDERPAEIEKFWRDAVGGLNTVEKNIGLLKQTNYQYVASFVLPDGCWIENYFVPREKAQEKMREKYQENKLVEEYITADKYEMALYEKYKQHYGYVFYIAKKSPIKT